MSYVTSAGLGWHGHGAGAGAAEPALTLPLMISDLASPHRSPRTKHGELIIWWQFSPEIVRAIPQFCLLIMFQCMMVNILQMIYTVVKHQLSFSWNASLLLLMKSLRDITSSWAALGRVWELWGNITGSISSDTVHQHQPINIPNIWGQIRTACSRFYIALPFIAVQFWNEMWYIYTLLNLPKLALDMLLTNLKTLFHPYCIGSLIIYLHIDHCVYPVLQSKMP